MTTRLGASPYRYLPGRRVVAVRAPRWADYRVGDTGTILASSTGGASGAIIAFDDQSTCWVPGYELELLTPPVRRARAGTTAAARRR